MLWRVSVADIARDGPFSSFPGIDRRTALLVGRGFRLGDATVSAAHSIIEYSGDSGGECVLADGPVRVLNVFAARGRVSGRIRWLRVHGETVVASNGVAVCVEGVANVGDLILHPCDSMRFDGPLTVGGSGVLLVVTLT